MVQGEVIAKISTALRDTRQVAHIAPGRCTGEPTFSALRQAFGERYWYAGLGSVLSLSGVSNASLRGDAAVFSAQELALYQQIDSRSHDAEESKLAEAGKAIA